MVPFARITIRLLLNLNCSPVLVAPPVRRCFAAWEKCDMQNQTREATPLSSGRKQRYLIFTKFTTQQRDINCFRLQTKETFQQRGRSTCNTKPLSEEEVMVNLSEPIFAADQQQVTLLNLAVSLAAFV